MLHKLPVKTGIVTVALALLAWFLLFGKATRGKLPCASWFASEFFEAATVADVSRCLEHRFWVFGSGELKALLEGWANIKEGGFTPLHMAAAHSDSPDVVKALLDAEANIEARNENGQTPLHYAATSGSPDVVKVLLDSGANIEARDEHTGVTPLHAAAAHSDSPDVVKVLLDSGANIEARDEQNGGTPLHLAAALSDSPDVVKVLLDSGANIEARDEQVGATPLHAAAQFSKSPDVVKVLLDAGANIDARTANTDFTPADLIQRNDALKGTDAYSLLLDVNR